MMRLLRFSIVFILCLLALFQPGVYAMKPFTWNWSPMVPLRSPRALMMAINISNYVYIVGGQSDANSYSYTIDRLNLNDPSAAGWETYSTIPYDGISGNAFATLYDGVIYFAEAAGQCSPSRTFFLFDVAANQWRQGPPSLLLRNFGALVGYGSQLYLFGGGDVNGNSIPYVERYNIPTNGSAYNGTWEQLSIQTPQEFSVCNMLPSVIGDVVYFAGGINCLSNYPTSTFFAFNFTSQQFIQTLPQIPQPGPFLPVISVNNRYIVILRYEQVGDPLGIYFDIITKQFTTVRTANLTNPRFESGTMSLDGSILLIGGVYSDVNSYSELVNAFEFQIPTSTSSSSFFIIIAFAAGACVIFVMSFTCWIQYRNSRIDHNAVMSVTKIQRDIGKFVIIQKLGQGGFGCVYLVRRKSDKRLLAMKYIECTNDDARADAMAEFEVIKKLQGHPHMIAVVDMFMNWQVEANSDDDPGTKGGFTNNSIYRSSSATPEKNTPQSPNLTDSESLLSLPRYVCIVTEYFEDGDLKKYVVNYPAEVIPESEIINIGKQMCDLLVYLHSQKPPVVHRDIKPENILVDTKKQQFVLTDFGLARIAEHTFITTQAGSLPWVAPELWQRQVTTASDMWSLGCILYAVCTKRVGSTNTRVMFSDAQKPRFHEEIAQDLWQYPVLTPIILKLLQVNPKNRASAEWTLKALTGSVSQLTVQELYD